MTEGAQAASQLVPSRGRIIAIDIVRGFAILWVILYHLWTDIKYPNVHPVPDYFSAVPDRIGEGAFPGMLTAVSDAFLRVGYLGVPLFMILSGLSLTLVALRRDMTVSESPRFLYQRFRRVMIPYWFGFAYTVAFAGALAFVQWQRHGGAPFADYYRHGDISLASDQLVAGLLVVPRAFKSEWQFAPEGSLWFVIVLAQYYLLFPILLAAMKRVGPWLFLLAALAVTLVSLNLVVAYEGSLVDKQYLVETVAPFRLFEFALGMVAGYLMVERPALLLEYTRAPLDIGGMIVIGLLLFVGGCMIDPARGGGIVTFAPVLLAVGMGLVVLPLVVKLPGRLEVSSPGRVIAWVGVISYTVLIVNEPLRSITHTMRVEDAAMGWDVLWIGVLYMPITLLAARPLAVFLGLVERDRGDAVPAPVAATGEATSLQA